METVNKSTKGKRRLGFEMPSIQVDVRETALIEQIELIFNAAGPKKNFAIEKLALPIGDVILKTCDSKPIVIIERKTIADLVSSLSDGRYKEQSFRLLNHCGIESDKVANENGSAGETTAVKFHHHNVVYVIEGVLSSVSATIRKQVNGAIISLNFFKGFSVIRTSSVKETAELIVHFATKVDSDISKKKLKVHYQKDNLGLALNSNDGLGKSTPSHGTYAEAAICKQKSANISPNNIGTFMLAQIPGISVKTAVQLLNHFDNSIFKLLETVRNGNIADLNTIKIQGANEKERKISKTIIQELTRFFGNKIITV